MQVRKREEIDEKLKWRLEDIYKSEDLIDEDIKKVQVIVDKICSYQGKLNNKENILAIFKLDDDCIPFLLEDYFNFIMILFKPDTITDYINNLRVFQFHYDLI